MSFLLRCKGSAAGTACSGATGRECRSGAGEADAPGLVATLGRTCVNVGRRPWVELCAGEGTTEECLTELPPVFDHIHPTIFKLLCTHPKRSSSDRRPSAPPGPPRCPDQTSRSSRSIQSSRSKSFSCLLPATARRSKHVSVQNPHEVFQSLHFSFPVTEISRPTVATATAQRHRLHLLPLHLQRSFF